MMYGDHGSFGLKRSLTCRVPHQPSPSARVLQQSFSSSPGARDRKHEAPQHGRHGVVKTG
eukprot:1225328-Rhodomonas_salina.1